MEEIREELLRFVAQHWKAGLFDPKRARRRFCEEGIPLSGRPVWGYAFAAALAVLVLGLFLFHKTPTTVIPATAGIQAVILPDGTRATLAPGATLSFLRHGFGRRDRSVCQTGKVYFAVERNESVPFEVTAEEGFVRVLGTRFQIETDSTGTAVDVEEGRVLFTTAPSGDGKTVREKGGLVLTRGMHAVLTPGASEPALTGTETPNPTAWATHTFRYDDTPLDEVLLELSEQYGKDLAADRSDRRLTGEFEGSDLEEIVALIEEALNLNIYIK